MKSFLIANPKGGSGKSMLATNLAGLLARQGHRVMLGDTDRQQSSRQWLDIRPAVLPRIESWCIEAGKPARPPAGTTHAVLDSPAGLHGAALTQALDAVERVIVPLQPSLFDILATRQFLEALARDKRFHGRGNRLAVVGMRVDARTRAAAELERFLAGLGLPVLACLRDTQNYVQAAAHGMTIFDLSLARSAQDREQWLPIMEWIAA